MSALLRGLRRSALRGVRARGQPRRFLATPAPPAGTSEMENPSLVKYAGGVVAFYAFLQLIPERKPNLQPTLRQRGWCMGTVLRRRRRWGQRLPP